MAAGETGFRLLVKWGPLVFAIGIADLFAIVPMLFRVLTKRFQLMHRSVVSDIPGNIHAFDDSMISLFRTLPELSNFNIVWTNLPLHEPLILTVSIAIMCLLEGTMANFMLNILSLCLCQ